jgi:cell division septum initiation protein DivIVA
MTTLRVTRAARTFTLESMADGEAGAAHLDARLDTVRRGYDPQQVRRLVGALSAELKSLDEENDDLRHELERVRHAGAAAGAASAVGASRTPHDIVDSWTRETNEMLEGARQQVSRIMDKANADAAAVVAAAETDAADIRARAEADAAQLTLDARRRADDMLSDAQLFGEQERTQAEQRAAAIIRSAEQRADEIVAAAHDEASEQPAAPRSFAADTTERRDAVPHGDPTWAAPAGSTGAPAVDVLDGAATHDVRELSAEAERLRAEIDELRAERQSMREQFVSTQVYLQGLVSLIDGGARRDHGAGGDRSARGSRSSG